MCLSGLLRLRRCCPLPLYYAASGYAFLHPLEQRSGRVKLTHTYTPAAVEHPRHPVTAGRLIFAEPQHTLYPWRET